MNRASKVVPFRQTSEEEDETVVEKSLLPELSTLRGALEIAFRDMKDGEGSADRARSGGLVAKLADSIGRALLSDHKLSLGVGSVDWIHDEMRQVLIEMQRQRKEDEGAIDD